MNVQTPLANVPRLPVLEMDVLQTFLAIVETESFSKAAGRVHRTPSAVSMQIRKLEDLLGKSLFVRDSRSVKTAADGEMLAEYARRMLALNAEVMSRFLNPQLTGTVRLGAPEDFGAVLLPSILKRFAETHPNIAVDAVIDLSVNLQERFKQGQLDLVLLTCSRENGILADAFDKHAIELLEEPLVWCGVKGGCAHEREPLPVSMWEPGCSWRANTVKALKRSGRAHRTAYMSEYYTAQKAAILADLAVAPYALSLIEPPLVRLGEAAGLPDLGRYQLVLRTKPDAGPAEQAVVDHVIASFEAFKNGEKLAAA